MRPVSVPALFGVVLGLHGAAAFVPSHIKLPASNGVLLRAKPTFNKSEHKWEKADDDDGIYPYDAVGSFLRFGLQPFVKRLTDPNGYEQDVLEYMASEGVSRAEATGNMDAKLFNAADWAYSKMEERNGRPKVDLTKLDTKQAVLTVAWTLVVIASLIWYFLNVFSKYL